MKTTLKKTIKLHFCIFLVPWAALKICSNSLKGNNNKNILKSNNNNIILK